jgi:hypothetical protein
VRPGPASTTTIRRKIVNSPILGIADHLAAVTPDDRDSRAGSSICFPIFSAPAFLRWDQKFESTFLQGKLTKPCTQGGMDPPLYVRKVAQSLYKACRGARQPGFITKQ